MKKKIIIVAIIILIMLGVKGFIYFTATPQELQCRAGGGRWQMRNNGLWDNCNKIINAYEVVKPGKGCECGENRCWNGAKCVGEKK